MQEDTAEQQQEEEEGNMKTVAVEEEGDTIIATKCYMQHWASIMCK
jgi:hypothetical protein